jgi:hypothetical protein
MEERGTPFVCFASSPRCPPGQNYNSPRAPDFYHGEIPEKVPIADERFQDQYLVEGRFVCFSPRQPHPQKVAAVRFGDAVPEPREAGKRGGPNNAVHEGVVSGYVSLCKKRLEDEGASRLKLRIRGLSLDRKLEKHW